MKYHRFQMIFFANDHLLDSGLVMLFSGYLHLENSAQKFCYLVNLNTSPQLAHLTASYKPTIANNVVVVFETRKGNQLNW